MERKTKLISWSLFMALKRLAVIGVMQSALAIALALEIKKLLSGDFTAGFDIKIILPFLIVFLIAALKWLERLEAERVGQDFVHDIRRDLFDHLSRLSFRTFARKRKGPLLLRFMNDLTALRQWVTIGLARLLVSSIIFISALFALFYINVTIGLWLAGLFVSGAGAAFFLGRYVNAAVRESRKRRSVLASGITEKIMTMPSIQILARRQMERRDFLRKSKRLKNAMQSRAGTIGALRALTRFIGNMALIITAIIGGIGLGNGTINTGELFAVLALTGFITPALYNLGRVYEYWHGAQIAREKIDNLLNLQPLILPPVKGSRARISGLDISIENISFAPALRNINAHAEYGEKILLSGANGSGKSTLLHLLMRLDEADAGKILLGNKPIVKMGIGSLRRTITLASSDDPLFKGSLAKNLCYPGQINDLGQARPLLDALGMDIDDKKSAFYKNRQIREAGSNLSKGEASAIIIARALLMQPKILLLDEVDVHLDKKMKAAFYKVLGRFDGTIIAASHDKSYLDICDTVWNLKKGRIEILPSASFKQKFHNLQLADFNRKNK